MNYLLNGGLGAAYVFGIILYGPKLLGFVVVAVLVYFGGWKQLKDGNPWIGGAVIIGGFLACAWILFSLLPPSCEPPQCRPYVPQ